MARSLLTAGALTVAFSGLLLGPLGATPSSAATVVLFGDPVKGEQPFPFDKLQLVQAGYLAPAASTPTPTPTPTPTVAAPKLTSTSTASAFTVRADYLPAGGSLRVWWGDSAGDKSGSTTQATFSASTASSWGWAYAEVWDAQGKVLATANFSK